MFTFAHLILTPRAYAGLDEAELRQALLPARARGSAGTRGWRDRLRDLRERLWDRCWRADVPAWSVQVSALALAVVVLIIAIPTLRESPLPLVCIFAMVGRLLGERRSHVRRTLREADLRTPSLGLTVVGAARIETDRRPTTLRRANRVRL